MNKTYFKDKVIIITGASSGIGLASARLFGSCGAKVVMAARHLDKLQAEVPSVSAEPENVLCVKTDVSKEEDCKMLINKAVEKFGRIDILVNNAGISMRAMFKDLDLSVIKSLMDVNFWGTVYCTKYALPYLLHSKGLSSASFLLPAIQPCPQGQVTPHPNMLSAASWTRSVSSI